MPSFDIVSQADMQAVDNAVNSVKREIDQRYDFKGTKCSVERKDNEITINADDEHKRRAIEDMFKVHFTRQKIDPKALSFEKPQAASGNTIRQIVKIKQGVDQDNAKKIVKFIKDSKMKVQASIRGDEVRVDGKKIDDLQEAIALVKGMDMELPLQYINFRS